MDLRENVAALLKELRQNAGMTQQQVADYLHITRQGYARYEQGKSQPLWSLIFELADLYGLEVKIHTKPCRGPRCSSCEHANDKSICLEMCWR